MYWKREILVALILASFVAYGAGCKSKEKPAKTPAANAKKETPSSTEKPAPPASEKKAPTAEEKKPTATVKAEVAPKSTTTSVPEKKAEPKVKKLSPQELVSAAIAAHGGLENLKKGANMRIATKGKFMGKLPYTAEFHWKAPGSWTVIVNAMAHPIFAGRTPTSCWNKPHEVVFDCDEGEAKGRTDSATAINAGRLYPLAGQALKDGGVVKVGDLQLQAVKWKEVTLGFHPENRRLIYLSHAGWRKGPGTVVEYYSKFKTIDGVVVATHLKRTFEGKPEIEEEWTSFQFGKADDKLLGKPKQVADGKLMHIPPHPHVVSQTSFVGGANKISQAVERLVAFAAKHKLAYVRAGGVIMSVTKPGATPEQQQWRVSVPLEAYGKVTELSEGDLHIKRMPAYAYVGVFHVGPYEKALRKTGALKTYIEKNKLTLAAEGHIEVQGFNDPTDTPAKELVSFVRMAVKEVPPGTHVGHSKPDDKKAPGAN